MSKSSKTLLIVGGDSWTDIAGSHWYQIKNIQLWPYKVAKHFDCDVVNAGQGGASNGFIANQTMDAIYKHYLHADYYDNCIVMILWSEGRRLNPWNNQSRAMIDLIVPSIEHLEQLIDDGKEYHIENYRVGAELRHFYRKKIIDYKQPNKTVLFFNDIIEDSYRNMYLINDLCKRNNISIIHGKALPTVSHIPNTLELTNDEKTKLDLHDYVGSLHKEDLDHLGLYWYNKAKEITNVIAGKNITDTKPMIDYMKTDPEKYLLPCCHPNQEGNDVIFKFFSSYPNEPDENIEIPMDAEVEYKYNDFVYD
jgi:hypothetical protein